jgi:NitT/TauT family transport system permease protein
MKQILKTKIQKLGNFLFSLLKKIGNWFREFFLELFWVFRDFFKLRTTPGKKVSPLLSNLLFVLVIFLYSTVATVRHETNSKDKITPTFGMMWTAIKNAVFVPKIEYQYNDTTGERFSYTGPETLRQGVSRDLKNLKETKHSSIFKIWKNGETKKMLQNGESLILKDAIVSGRIVVKAMGLIFLGVFFGLYMGVSAYLEKILYKFVLFFDKIPALAVLPILYVVMGTGENTKIALIVIGVAPTIILDTYLRAKAVHDEQIVTGLTLGASTPEITYKIVFPQIFPDVLNTIRLNFKSVILFLLAGEGINASAGVGYRIFVAKRTIDMATIIPYVLLISLAAFLVDWLFRALIKSYKWLNK